MSVPAAFRGRGQSRGRATRARILAAATRLFVRDGYLATTMATIAAEAGVAVQSLYLRFGSKLAILSAALDVAIVGDDEPVPLLERPWMRELRQADGPGAVRLLVVQVRRVLERTYPLYAVMQSAAAGEAGALLADNKHQRFEGERAVAGELCAKSGFAADLSVDRAADLLYALLSEEHYGLLVAERGWSPEAWEAWCIDTLVQVLFPGADRRQLGS